MSTNISDLPGPINDEDEYENENEYENNDNETMIEQVEQVEQVVDKKENFENYKLNNIQNISGKIMKKKNLKKKEMFTDLNTNFITNEFNQNNALILVIIYLSTLPLSNEYTYKLLKALSMNYFSSSTTINIIKCILLLLVYLIVKIFILPALE